MIALLDFGFQSTSTFELAAVGAAAKAGREVAFFVRAAFLVFAVQGAGATGTFDRQALAGPVVAASHVAFGISWALDHGIAAAIHVWAVDLAIHAFGTNDCRLIAGLHHRAVHLASVGAAARIANRRTTVCAWHCRLTATQAFGRAAKPLVVANILGVAADEHRTADTIILAGLLVSTRTAPCVATAVATNPINAEPRQAAQVVIASVCERTAGTTAACSGTAGHRIGPGCTCGRRSSRSCRRRSLARRGRLVEVIHTGNEVTSHQTEGEGKAETSKSHSLRIRCLRSAVSA